MGGGERREARRIGGREGKEEGVLCTNTDENGKAQQPLPQVLKQNRTFC